eukprot:628941-Prorocentrum_minimum.AAC.2
MVTALEFDSVEEREDDGASDVELEEPFTNYNRHVFRVVATTPAMSISPGHTLFIDEGSVLPQ